MAKRLIAAPVVKGNRSLLEDCSSHKDNVHMNSWRLEIPHTGDGIHRRLFCLCRSMCHSLTLPGTLT